MEAVSFTFAARWSILEVCHAIGTRQEAAPCCDWQTQWVSRLCRAAKVLLAHLDRVPRDSLAGSTAHATSM